MNEIEVVCSGCGISTSMPPEVIGKKLRCKKCGQIFRAANADVEIAIVDDPLPTPEPELLPLAPVTPFENAPLNPAPLNTVPSTYAAPARGARRAGPRLPRRLADRPISRRAD